jgi:hypothetical protein
MFGPLTGLLCKLDWKTPMNKLFHLRQFASDAVRPIDLWMLFCGSAIALFLAWLF